MLTVTVRPASVNVDRTPEEFSAARVVKAGMEPTVHRSVGFVTLAALRRPLRVTLTLVCATARLTSS